MLEKYAEHEENFENIHASHVLNYEYTRTEELQSSPRDHEDCHEIPLEGKFHFDSRVELI